MKLKMMLLLLLMVVIAQAKDNLIFSGGIGSASIGSTENKYYDASISMKNEKVILIANYSRLSFTSDELMLDMIDDKMTNREINEISFLMGKCLTFGKYSSFNISSGIGIIFVEEEFNNSFPLLPEKNSKDFSLPVDFSVNIGLLNFLGVSTHIKKSFNDIAQYFSYSFSIDIIF